MKAKDFFTWDFSGSDLQEAYRSYFAEQGVLVGDWDAYFQKMSDGPTTAMVRRNSKGTIIGFIQCSKLTMTSWFFEDTYGFVEEFWVAPEYRCKGHGSEMLKNAEERFASGGVTHMILTTDSAEAFYLHRGYRREKGIAARNLAPVYVKQLE